MSASIAIVAAWGVVLAVAVLALVHWMHGRQLDAHRDAVHGAAREMHELRLALVAPRNAPPPRAAARAAVHDVAAASPDTRTDVLRYADLAAKATATGDLTVGDRYGVPRLGPGTELCMSIDQGYPCAREEQHDPPHLDVDSNGRITHVWTDKAAPAVSER